MQALTFIVLLKCGKKTNISMAHDRRENVSKEVVSRDAKQTAAKTAAFNDTESDTLQRDVYKCTSNTLCMQYTFTHLAPACGTP